MMTDDMDLVRAYAVGQSEPAFAELVARHVNLVYSAGLRQTGDPHLAEEITQAVFILLARKAGALGPDTILPSWLHRTAGFVAADAVKARQRRARRELEAVMQSLLNEPSPCTAELWPHIAPLLDRAVAGLKEPDRHAIVLRYFENRSLAEVGRALGTNEDAARMRVNRALEKLRQFFAKRGVNSTTALLAGAMSAHSVQAAPAGLAGAVTALAVTKGAAAGASTLTLIQGALKMMAWTKAKLAIMAGIAVIVAAGTSVVVIRHQFPSPSPAPRTPVTDMAYIPGRTYKIDPTPRTLPAKSATELNSINLENTDVRQVLDLYKPISGLDLTIAPEVQRLNAVINLRIANVDRATLTQMLEQALLEQAGIVITKKGNTATLTYNGRPVAHPQMAMPPPPRPSVEPK